MDQKKIIEQTLNRIRKKYKDFKKQWVRGNI